MRLITKLNKLISSKCIYEKYTTDEIFTGKYWIDGKKIYRKIFYFGTLPNNTTKELETGDLKIDDLITLRGFAKNSSYHILIPYNHSGNVNSQAMLYYNISSNSIIIRSGSNMESYNAYIFLEYTKTVN